MAGSYRVIPHPLGEVEPTDIGFHVIPNVPISDGDRKLASQITKDVARLKRSAQAITDDWKHDPRFRQSFDGFLDAARAGVEDPHADLGNGIEAVDQAEEFMLHTIGRALKTRHLVAMSKMTTCLVVVASVTAVLGSWASNTWPKAEPYMIPFQAGSYALIGIAASVWLSSVFYVRKVDIARLDYMDPDGFTPSMRFALIAVIAGIVMITLAFQVLTLGLGSVLLNDFTKRPSIAILIGLLCGLAEVRITEIILGIFNPEVRVGASPKPASITAAPPTSERE